MNFLFNLLLTHVHTPVHQSLHSLSLLPPQPDKPTQFFHQSPNILHPGIPNLDLIIASFNCVCQLFLELGITLHCGEVTLLESGEKLVDLLEFLVGLRDWALLHLFYTN